MLKSIVLILYYFTMQLNEMAGLKISYFAYGSNINAISFEQRRNIKPFTTECAILYDHKIVFNILTPSSTEPSFASIQPCQGSTVHGILYDIEFPSDWIKLCSSEGVPIAYSPYNIQVEVYSDQKRNTKRLSQAITLRASFPSQNTKNPSGRYLSLILEGCRDKGIDPAYIEQLRSLYT
jgi:hypothetical protein